MTRAQPQQTVLIQDEPDGMALVIETDGDVASITQYDCGLARPPDDSVAVTDSETARNLATWLNLWADWWDGEI